MVYMLTLGVYWWDPCYHIPYMDPMGNIMYFTKLGGEAGTPSTDRLSSPGQAAEGVLWLCSQGPFWGVHRWSGDGCTRPGKHRKNDGKSPFSMGKLTISMAIFNSKLLNYQRVWMEFDPRNPIFSCGGWVMSQVDKWELRVLKQHEATDRRRNHYWPSTIWSYVSRLHDRHKPW